MSDKAHIYFRIMENDISATPAQTPQTVASTTPAPPVPAPTVSTPSQNNFKKRLPFLFLKIGIAFVFLYAAIFVSGNAQTGGKYVPSFVTAIIPLPLFLLVFGIFEALLAVWIVTGKLRFYSGLIAAIVLIGITAIDYTYFNVTFRNVAIICACLAFAFTE